MSEESADNLNDVAIVAMEARLPGAATVERFWENVRGGVESVRFLDGAPAVVHDGVAHVKAAPLLEGIELFDASLFGFSAGEAEVMDPQIRLFLECAWTVLEKAGCDPQQYPGRVGVFAGTAASSYLVANLLPNLEQLRGPGGGLDSYGVFNDRDALATLVAYKFDLTGPAVTVQTFCSTSLVAVHLACQSLLGGECDLALAGAATINVQLERGYYYQEGGILSPDGHTRTFDARSAGTVFGNGVGVVALKRLADARAEGDVVHAVIRGSAMNNDGSQKAGYTAPSVTGQAKAIAEAMSVAGVRADSIGYVEAHGTATAVGDPIEIEALTRAFRMSTARRGYCAIGSVKANFGHLDRASGIASLIKTVLMLRHRELPPLVHFEAPNPKIDFDASPFYVNRELRPWPPGPDGLRRAGVSALGVGGTNAHVVVEEAPPPLASGPSRAWQLLVLSARTQAGLDSASERLAAWLREASDASLADVASTLLRGRRRFEHRRFVVAASAATAAQALEFPETGPGGSSGYSRASERPVVFMFPGQGAQYPDMTRGLYESERVFRAELDACCERLREPLGLDLRELLYPRPEGIEAAAEQLKQTALTQPALFAVEHALARLWLSWGIEPSAMIGHSVGEYVAATLAGVLERDTALALVAERGRLMQSLPAGAMLALPLPAAEVAPLLGDELDLAAVNAPTLCVVSGPVAAVDALEQELRHRELPVTRLRISHAFHSRMMEPILARLRERLRGISLRPPRIPYVSNLTGTWIDAEQATREEYWIEHLRRPVRFADGIATLLVEPKRVLLEVGPGNALCGLARAQAPRGGELTAIASLRQPQEDQPDLPTLLGALGRLWLAGVRVDAGRLFAGERRSRVELPTYPLQRERYWIDVEPGAPPQVSRRAKRDPSEWFYLPAWRTAPPAGALAGVQAAERGRAWLLLVEGAAGDALAQRLRAEGDVVIVARPGARFAGNSRDGFVVDPSARPDYDLLLRALGDQGRTIGNVVHGFAAGTAHGADPTREVVARGQRIGFYSLLYLVQALVAAEWTQPLHLKLLTTCLQGVLGDDPLEPEKGTLLGLLKVIPQEQPSLTCAAIDVDQESFSADGLAALVAELRARTPGAVVALRRGQRFVQEFEPLPLAAPEGKPARLRDRGVYLITGGLGGVPSVLAATLAHACQARLVLTARGTLPPRTEWDEWRRGRGDHDPVSLRIARVQALEGLGAEVMVASADVADAEAMRGVMDAAERRFGPLNGVIHGAGIVAGGTFRSLQQLGAEECEQQFHPKLDGVVALDLALGSRPLDFCLLTSSLSGVLGGITYGAYAAANVFMDAYAGWRNRRGAVPWLSVNWDEWRLAERPAAGDGRDLARFAMSPLEGAGAFLRLLGLRGVPQVVVSSGDLKARCDEWVRLEGARSGAAAAKPSERKRHARPQLHNAYVAPATPVQEQVARVWAELLGIERVGLHDNFFDLGGHSLLAIQVATRLRAELGAQVSVATLFEGPTVESLSRLIGSAGEESPAGFDQSSDRGRRRKEERLRRKTEPVEDTA